MKRPMQSPFWITLVAIVVGVFYNTHAQMQLGFRFKMKNEYGDAYPLNLQYQDKGAVKTKKIHGKKLLAALEPDSGGKIKVVFWGFSEPYSDLGSSTYVNALDSTDNFYVEVEKCATLRDIKKYRSFPYACTEIGVVTIPFRYRFGTGGTPNDASTDFSVSVYAGRKWGRQRFYYNKEENHASASFMLAGFAGPTVVKINKDNIRSDDTAGFTRGESNELAVSVGLGALYSYCGFNIGLFGGVDLPLGAVAQQWRYAGTPWLGFGIGYQLKMFTGKD